MQRLGLRLTPQRRLLLDAVDEATPLDEKLAQRLVAAFIQGSGQGLLQLGGCEIAQALPPDLAWWRAYAARYIGALCLAAGGTDHDDATSRLLPEIAPPSPAELTTLELTRPLMQGAEYLDAAALLTLWSELGVALAAGFSKAKVGLQDYLQSLAPAWNLVGRVHFNLAENRRDPERPFAFMVTYTTRLSAQAKAQHMPLGQALREYAGAAHRDKLLSLLLPVQRAGQSCPWLKQMVDTGEIFHPLRWGPADAARFLGSVPDLERSGVVVRMPPAWKANRPARPQVTAVVGTHAPSAIGLDALIDFQMGVSLDGAPLSKAEIAALLAGTDSLMLLRGQWVEVDRERLERAIEQFREAQALAERDGLTFAEAIRMLSGTSLASNSTEVADGEWTRVSAGPWLADTLKAIRSIDGTRWNPGTDLKGTLRPYQKAGVQWLQLLSALGLGACLADDMGLGKTIQVLAMLLLQRRNDGTAEPSLLVAPASLLANWVAEIERFAPSLATRVAHPSVLTANEAKEITPEGLAKLDLVITSYGSLLRVPAFGHTKWRHVILDEAQAIKNPNAKQTRAAKALASTSRIALTGTPVENHLGDLWSIFDFINPGLLGTAKQFKSYAKSLADRQHNPYGPLRELVRPYILRRMKTDKSIIADLPDKTEIKAWCGLSRKQAALYGQTVAELEKALEETGGIQRKGIVLASLMRLKQICNHPSQWLQDNAWAEADSGKLARLREIAEVVAARQEKMLLFTQFRETTEPLAGFLAGVFGRTGVVLSGETAVKNRRALVDAFQQDESVPFFVLSTKAGGSGLNLTAASHVVHYDRWWNPAVENQATDRAFRIGQTKNVLVHKFVCRGTVEEKIDALIESKKGLSAELLDGEGGVNLTELRDDELLRLVNLDLAAAMQG